MNCRQSVEERSILSLQEEAMMEFDYYEVYQTKYCYDNVKKSKFSFSRNFHADEKSLM